MYKVVVFDCLDKFNLMKGWLKKKTSIFPVYASNPDLVIRKLTSRGFDALLLGGDIEDGQERALKLAGQLVSRDLVRFLPFTLITTWDTDEARAVKGMIPKALYVPFSRVVANMVIENARIRKRFV